MKRKLCKINKETTKLSKSRIYIQTIEAKDSRGKRKTGIISYNRWTIR